MRNITKSNRRVQFFLSPEHLERYRNAAESADVPLSAWIKMALSSYHSNWISPAEKREKRGLTDAKTKGMFCILCNVPAVKCQLKSKHSEKLWVEHE